MSLEGMRIIRSGTVEKVENPPERKIKLDRTAQAKWDRKHLRTVSTKLRKEDYDELIDRCMLWGISPYEEMRRLLMAHVIGRSPE